MNVQDTYTEAWEGIQNGFESGRLAHAYIIVGAPRGNALKFAESFLKLMFCESADKPCEECASCRRVEAHKHVDTLWIEPQSKSRQIKADEIRALVQRISQTSFEGGWKAGVILSADCMNENSANALLKTLEEPPPRTILLLVTSSPQALLPTINSRCQKIVLSEGNSATGMAEWHAPLMTLLRDLPPVNGLDAARFASILKALFDEVKAGIADTVEADINQADESMDESKLKEIMDARINALLKEVQADVFKVILDWHRDVLMLTSSIDNQDLNFADEFDVLKEQSELQTQGSMLKSIRAVEEMARRLERNLPALQVFDEAFRKLTR